MHRALGCTLEKDLTWSKESGGLPEPCPKGERYPNREQAREVGKVFQAQTRAVGRPVIEEGTAHAKNRTGSRGPAVQDTREAGAEASGCPGAGFRLT